MCWTGQRGTDILNTIPENPDDGKAREKEEENRVDKIDIVDKIDNV